LAKQTSAEWMMDMSDELPPNTPEKQQTGPMLRFGKYFRHKIEKKLQF
jgi:hypothetical protein